MKYLPSLFVVIVTYAMATTTQSQTPTPEVAAGSTQYLDYKNGFRGALFGMTPEQIGGLKLDAEISEANRRNGDPSKWYTRATDNLSLNNEPLYSIFYIFHNDKLIQVFINARYKNKPATDLFSTFLSSLYGKPTERAVERGVLGVGVETILIWRGDKVVLRLEETHGNSDSKIYCFYISARSLLKEYTKARDAANAAQAREKKDGL